MRSEPRFESPQLIADRYRLLRSLGHGGMADVYEGFDIRLGRPVAVKMFRANADETARRRFEAEARLLAGLDHPGLVTVHDAGVSHGEPYLIMRLVEGETLADRLTEGPLPESEVLDLGRQLAGILAYVHETDVVHRDVKPSNVLLSDDGRAFLADFGISRLISACERVTATGKIIGTVGYLAPEQVLGADATQAVDVYALGLVLLECVTGRPEYEGTGVEAAVARLHRAPRVPDELTDPLAATIQAMTAAKAERRPSMADCAAMLDGRIAAPGRAARRRWALAGASFTGLAAVAVASALVLHGTDKPVTQAPLSPPATSPADTRPGNAPAAISSTEVAATPSQPPTTDSPSSLSPGAGEPANPVTTVTVHSPPAADSGANDGSTAGGGNGRGNGKSNGKNVSPQR